MRKSALVGVAGGLSEAEARAVLGVTVTGITAAGTTQADAFQLTVSNSVLSTVGAGSGVKVPVMQDDGDELTIVNLGANAVLVYGQTGQSIQTGAANAGFSVPSGKTLRMKRISSTLWVAMLSA